jgi:molecular chaperone DnaK (HSP70)
MPVQTRSQKNAQVQTPFQGKPETKSETKSETKPQTSLGIWYMETLQKYTKLSNEISHKMQIYRTSERYAAYRAMRFEQFRIATEMYHIITEYFNEVMNSESDIFVSSHKSLVNKSLEISKRNACKVYSPKTDEELEIILAFQDVLMEVDEMLNPKFIYDLVEKAEKYAEKLKAEKEAEELKAEKEAEELELEEEEDLKDEDYVDEEEDETEDLEAEEEIYELLMETKNGYQNKHIRFVYGNE